ncbi:MAG: tetraacyldisaccharide 4'-kinase [Psychromonas sp.]|jgi:tetraacyldisaccharide 4'-kinase
MTEKDAVKCTDFAQPNWWYLPVSAEFPARFEKKLLNRIKEIKC